MALKFALICDDCGGEEKHEIAHLFARLYISPEMTSHLCRGCKTDGPMKRELEKYLGAPVSSTFETLRSWWTGASSDLKANVPSELDPLIAVLEGKGWQGLF